MSKNKNIWRKDVQTYGQLFPGKSCPGKCCLGALYAEGPQYKGIKMILYLTMLKCRNELSSSHFCAARINEPYTHY